MDANKCTVAVYFSSSISDIVKQLMIKYISKLNLSNINSNQVMQKLIKIKEKCGAVIVYLWITYRTLHQ